MTDLTELMKQLAPIERKKPPLPDLAPQAAYLRAATLEWRCRHAWHVEALGSVEPLDAAVAEKTGAMTDGNGFPFLWEAEARRELRAHPEVLSSPADLPQR